MKAASVAGLCVSLALSSAASADPKVGSYLPDIEAKEWVNTDGDPVSLAECRGMAVVLFCWVSWHEGGEAIMPLMTLVNNSRFGREAGVFLIGVTDSDRQRVEEMLQKEKVFFPIGLEAKKTFQDYDLTLFPRVIIVDTGGKVAWVGWPGDKGGNTLIEQLGKVLAETPPTRTHPEETAKVQAYLEQSRAALRGDRVREAFTAATSAFEHALRGDELKTRCQDVLDLIEALGRDKLAQAERALDEQKFEDAVLLLLELQREFRGMDVARTVKKKIEALQQKRPEVAELLRQHENVGQAEAMLAAAMDHLRARRFGVAYDKLEQIVDEFASTTTAAKAQTVLERMQANDGIMGYVRDHKASRTCRTLLSQAEAYVRTGRTSRARELYREIIDKYPDTTYADDAAQRLARLP